MNYSYLGKRSTLIWDGTDLGITNELYDVTCPNCQIKEHYSLKNMMSIESISEDLKRFIHEKNIVLKKNNYHQIKKNIPAYIIKIKCRNCKTDLWLVIGMKEVQPQRYNIYYKSVVY